MTNTVKIDQRQLDAILRKLKTIDRASDALRDPMQKSLALLWDEIASDPPRKNPEAFKRYATPAQKRAYWAKVGEAKKKGHSIHREGIGYVRTTMLGKQWTMWISRTTQGLRGKLGTVTPYAPYVQSDDAQQLFHKVTGWKTDKQVVERNAGKIQDIFQRAIKRILER